MIQHGFGVRGSFFCRNIILGVGKVKEKLKTCSHQKMRNIWIAAEKNRFWLIFANIANFSRRKSTLNTDEALAPSCGVVISKMSYTKLIEFVSSF